MWITPDEAAMDIRKTAFVLCLMTAAVFALTTAAAADDPVTKAEELVHALAARDYKSAEANFDATMQQGLPADKLKEDWEQITAQAGAYVKTGETKTVEYQGDTVILVKTLFKNGELWTQVAFDKSGRVAGLYFRPAN
jgi:Protein of unknown function (DUF3887)